MQTNSYLKAGIFSLGLVLSFVIAWECYWRSQGFEISYNDDESLWAHTRKQIYESSPSRPVVIGSSRIKFDLDIPTWESISGKKPIQLAMEGTTPRPVLSDLANDTTFKGTVLVGVVEVLFFAPDHSPFEIQANKKLAAYPKWSLSQQFSFLLNNFLESKLIFLQESTFSLGSLLKRLPIESRPGVFVFPNFHLKFSYVHPDRQNTLTPDLVKDPLIQEQVQGVWKKLIFTAKPGVGGDTLTGIIQSVKASVDKIKARGGQVVFIREPSNGPYLEVEKKLFPRDAYWDRLLKDTQCVGIHFEDYPALSKYTCPEWSHLSQQDAVTFTQDLVPILEEKAGWKIKN
jgi:hypothetical protein